MNPERADIQQRSLNSKKRLSTNIPSGTLAHTCSAHTHKWYDCYRNDWEDSSKFSLFLILFFNFTILYWFCHISTCICHRYTRVPHPESSKIFLIKETALSFSLLSMMLTVGLSYMAFFTKLKQKKFNLYEIAKAILRKKTEPEGWGSLKSDYTKNLQLFKAVCY